MLHDAAAFVDSVGINAHLSSEPYASRFAEFRALLGASGIRHVRDELRPGNDLSRWRDLHRSFGVRGHWLVSPATNTVPQMMEYLAAIGPETVSAVEGQNEGNSPWFTAQPQARPDWAAAVVAYQREAYRALRSRYAAERIPMLSPSVLDWKPDDMLRIQDAAPHCDLVAVHSYVQRAQEPETEDDYAALGWYLRRMRDPFKPGAPVMATETGYCTAAPRPGGTTVSERAAARYLPRLLLHNFAAGIVRTFLYEFWDGGPNPAEGEHNWGLLRHDGTPKPAYHAVRRLLGALATPLPVRAAVRDRAPGRLEYALDGAPANLRNVAFRRADGSVVVALWQPVRSWDPLSARDLPEAGMLAVLGRGPATGRMSLHVLRPVVVRVRLAGTWADPAVLRLGGGDWTTLPLEGGGVLLPVDDDVALLRLRPG